MNLSSKPSIKQLRDLIRSCDDDAGHHVLWVDVDGGVHLELLTGDMGPNGIPKKYSGTYKFRLESFARSHGNVGPEAARSRQWVERLYSELVKHWRDDNRGHVGV